MLIKTLQIKKIHAICCNSHILGKDWFILTYNEKTENKHMEDLSEEELRSFKANKNLYSITFQDKILTVYEPIGTVSFSEYYRSK